MRRTVDGRVVVILGASSGIGRAAANVFAGEGSKVVCAARGKAALDATVSEIRKAGGEAYGVPTDAAERAEVEALARQAVEHYGRIDVWVNMVGVATYGRLAETPPEEVERVMRVNFLSHVYATHPRCRTSGRRRAR